MRANTVGRVVFRLLGSLILLWGIVMMVISATERVLSTRLLFPPDGLYCMPVWVGVVDVIVKLIIIGILMFSIWLVLSDD